MLRGSEGKRSLDEAIEEIRGLEITPNAAETASLGFFEKLDQSHTALPETPRATWRLPVGMGIVAAAAFLIWILVKPGQHSSSAGGEQKGALAVASKEAQSESLPSITPLGARVALLADVDSHFTIERVEEKETSLRIDNGTLTVRLFPGQSPHQLSVRTLEHSFRATGTVYSVARRPSGTILKVHEGSVAVFDAKGQLLDTVGSGKVWGSNSRGSSLGNIAAARLLAYKSSRTKDAGDDQEDVRSEMMEGAEVSAVSTWRKARLFRAEDQPKRALEVLHGLISHDNDTWAALALIETIRILNERPEGIEDHREKLLHTAREFGTRFPNHSLMDEVQSIVCPLPNGTSALHGCVGNK